MTGKGKEDGGAVARENSWWRVGVDKLYKENRKEMKYI